ELNRQANQLAHYLRRLGVGPEVLVGIYLDRSLEMVVGMLGIIKAGGAYVPMDITQPKERLALLLEDVQPPVLLTQEGLVSGLPSHQATLVCLAAARDLLGRESGENLASQGATNSLVYVLFTSGSTGRPKGVAVEHRQLLNYVNGIVEQLDLPPGSRF